MNYDVGAGGSFRGGSVAAGQGLQDKSQELPVQMQLVLLQQTAALGGLEAYNFGMPLTVTMAVLSPTHLGEYARDPGALSLPIHLARLSGGANPPT